MIIHAHEFVNFYFFESRNSKLLKYCTARLLYSLSVNITEVVYSQYLSVGCQYLSVTEDSVIRPTVSSVNRKNSVIFSNIQ